METQAWHLKRLLSFTKNRLANRPHRPRDPALRDFLSSIGFEWPEPEQSGEGDDSDGDDSSYEYSDSSDSEDGVSTALANASKGPTKLTEALGGTLATYNVFYPVLFDFFEVWAPKMRTSYDTWSHMVSELSLCLLGLYGFKHSPDLSLRSLHLQVSQLRLSHLLLQLDCPALLCPAAPDW